MKIRLLSREAVIETDVSSDDIRLVEAYRPELLSVRENDRTVFRVELVAPNSPAACTYSEQKAFNEDGGVYLLKLREGYGKKAYHAFYITAIEAQRLGVSDERMLPMMRDTDEAVSAAARICAYPARMLETVERNIAENIESIRESIREQEKAAKGGA